MIGSSLPLCYPQIGAPNLFCLRALDQFCPLDKTYPTGGRPRVFCFFLASMDSVSMVNPPSHSKRVTQAGELQQHVLPIQTIRNCQI